MDKYILSIILSFLILKLEAQLTYEYTTNDSICIENNFNYFINLSSDRYLVAKDKKQYLTDKNGSVVVDLGKYNNLIVYPFNNNLTPVKEKKSGKYGYIDPDGNIKIPFLYEHAASFRDGVAIVRSDGKCGVIDTLNEMVFPMIYNDINAPDKNRFPVKKDQLYGVIDIDQKVIVDYKYLHASFLKNGVLKIQTAKGFQTIDLDDFKESKEVYEKINSFSNSLSSFKLDGKWGLIDSVGKIVLQNDYRNIGYLEKGISIIRSFDNKFGMINKDGDFLIPLEFDYIKNERTFVSANKGDNYYFFDHKGNRINEKITSQIKRIGPCNLFLKTSIDSLFSLQYLNTKEVFENVLFQEIKGISDGMLRSKINNSWYYYPLNQSKPIGPYKKINLFSDNKAIVQSTETGQFFVIDKTGESLTADYDEIKKHKTNYLFKENNKWGLSNNFSTIKTQYDELKILSHHAPIYKVKLNEKYGVIRDNKFILPIEYDGIKGDFFFKGVLEVSKNGAIAVVDIDGNILEKPKIGYVEYGSYGLTLLGTETGFGMIDDHLRFTVNPIYEELRTYKDGKRCSAKINGLWGFLNREGQFFIEPQFISVLDFSKDHDVTAVQDTTGWRLINDSGKFVTSNSYSDIRLVAQTKQSYFKIEVDGKWGVIDSEGKIVIPAIFTKIVRKRKYWILHQNKNYIHVDDNLNCIYNCAENEIQKVFSTNE